MVSDGARLRAAREAVGLSLSELARRTHYSKAMLGHLETGRRTILPEHLAAYSRALGDLPDQMAVETPAELEALELSRRVAASDVGDATLNGLEAAVDDLASSYATSLPADLLEQTRQHLRYVGRLLGARMTLAEHRRLLIAGGWLALLAGTLAVDLEHQRTARAYLGSARSIAAEAEHSEIIAWTFETEAWRTLTLGEYAEALRLSRTAQSVAPAGSSARIQATAQEGRAAARLHDQRATTAAVARVNALADPLTTPDRPEHHYRYDPSKAVSYTATTLSWVGDPAAVDYAREAIRSLSEEGARPRRLATARLDLALALVRQDEIDEAAASALVAMTSGRVVPSNHWRAREVTERAAAKRARVAAQLRDAYRDMIGNRA
ncbi:helix-turn-helix domain-containing protein [Pseudonocardia sp. CA-107938]|uniref:helix-turn-helix domain-containing protein n=1 Tax=Pseudonocardia sp. CA-107938 TaxID=3240021 RepID=UPI003D8D7651